MGKFSSAKSAIMMNSVVYTCGDTRLIREPGMLGIHLQDGWIKNNKETWIDAITRNARKLLETAGWKRLHGNLRSKI